MEQRFGFIEEVVREFPGGQIERRVAQGPFNLLGGLSRIAALVKVFRQPAVRITANGFRQVGPLELLDKMGRARLGRLQLHERQRQMLEGGRLIFLIERDVTLQHGERFILTPHAAQQVISPEPCFCVSRVGFRCGGHQ